MVFLGLLFVTYSGYYKLLNNDRPLSDNLQLLETYFELSQNKFACQKRFFQVPSVTFALKQSLLFRNRFLKTITEFH